MIRFSRRPCEITCSATAERLWKQIIFVWSWKNIPALMAYWKRLSCQRPVNIEELIRDLAEEDKVDGSALKKQGEDRQEKIRKLEERVELLAEQVEPVLAESDEKR